MITYMQATLQGLGSMLMNMVNEQNMQVKQTKL